MKKKLLFTLLALLVIQSISAQTYLNIYLDETGEALFLGETLEQPIFPGGIDLNNDYIAGTTQELTSKQGELWTFSYSLDNSEINIILPKYAIIKDISNGEISVEKNQMTVYASGSVSFDYIIEEYDESQVVLFWIVTILTIPLIILFIIYKFKRKSKKPQDKLEIIKGVLNEREKLILEKLKQQKQIKSSTLRKLCDLPKASFSRHLQELEKKDLIKRTGEGRNKTISLK